MKARLRRFSAGSGRSHGLGLALLLLVVVLVPSACLLWFMNQAMKNERLAVRQKLEEAYRGHLALAQQNLVSYWRQTGSELDKLAEELAPPALFARELNAGLADAIICFDSAGNVVYPNAAAPQKREMLDPGWLEARRLESSDLALGASAFATLAERATNTDLAARALQAQARCLVQAGKKDAALAVLLGPLADERYAQATDSRGALLAPNAQFMALELLKDSPREQTRAPLENLKKRLLDYDRSAMPASQRRFLMHELQRLFPEQTVFPTLAGEDLAARYVEAGVLRSGGAALHPTSLPGIWQFASDHGRVVALHEAERLQARMRAAIASQALPTDVRIDLLSPGQEADGSLLSQAVGPDLQGWRLALSVKDQRQFDTATSQRVASYLWIGVLVVAVVAALGFLALGLIRRQMALTALRNDLVANVTHELKTPLASMRLLVDTLLDSKELPSGTTREYLQLIASENLRLSRLIDNFLTFSRIERNKYAFHFHEVPAKAIVDSAVGAVRERFNEPGCRFEVHTAPDLPPVVVDADALVTALVNLLDNAYKYTGEQKQITVSASVENGCVRFMVKDNGIGLSPRDTKRIFKRFYQVDQSLTRTVGGCGLGLSIVQFIVTAHHGHVEVDSQPGQGSTFAISIPTPGTDSNQETKT